jgi:SP family general alpha glucoside:H+ symporter-like MFS transporter
VFRLVGWSSRWDHQQWYSDHEPYNFRSPIRIQFAVIGILLLVYLILPESPRWLIQTKRHERAKKTLAWLHKGVPGYQVDEQVAIMENTVVEERKQNAVIGGLGLGIFRGTNGWRLFIASWPKICQQFVGLSVFNTYATYVS